jgi:hypothetical protein
VPQMPPPDESTRPSGSSSAVEWYWRVTACAASGQWTTLAGSHRSAL